MRVATETRLCTVYRDTVLKVLDEDGELAVRVHFQAGCEYALPEWWFTPLLEQGALTAPGGDPPAPWGDSEPEPQPEPPANLGGHEE